MIKQRVIIILQKPSTAFGTQLIRAKVPSHTHTRHAYRIEIDTDTGARRDRDGDRDQRTNRMQILAVAFSCTDRLVGSLASLLVDEHAS